MRSKRCSRGRRAPSRSIQRVTGDAGHRVRPAERDAGDHAPGRRTRRNQLVHLRRIDDRRDDVPPTPPQRAPWRSRARLADRSHAGRDRRARGRAGGASLCALAARSRRRGGAARTDGQDAGARGAHRRAQRAAARAEERAQGRCRRCRWNGYVDFGFFVPIGNGGAGWVRDAGQLAVPAVLATTPGSSWATSWRPR